MYDSEEIREIINEAVSEEIFLLKEEEQEKYLVIQSLKSRLYDAFGLEDDVI